ncbi:DUF1565 domain-containing protein [Halorubrum sp. N11]|uniref:DUF1565 domain-containing protein n=1 Tax=Halorubrum sp. N11 TaxID=3402276 RepID=UPI003EBE7FD3
MTLDIQDFAAETSGEVSADDVPPELRQRLNDKLADLTGVEGGPSGPSADLYDAVVNAGSGSDDGSSPFKTIQAAINNSESGDVISVEAGSYGGFDVTKENLTLFGPNAGIAGDSDERGDEATITGGVFVDENPSDVVIDGLAIERTIGEAEGVVQIGSTSNPGANNLTIRNNVITATSNGPRNLGTILIEQIDGEIQIEDNLLTQTGDGAGEGLIRGLVQAVQLDNTQIVINGNTIETDLGVLPSGLDTPSPEYTITNNEFVENRFGVLVFGTYDADELQAFEQNTFTGAADTTYVQDRGNQLDLTAVESNNQFDPNASEGTVEGVDILVPEE